MADLRAPLARTKKFFNFIEFFRKFINTLGRRPRLWVAPPPQLEEALDPLLRLKRHATDKQQALTH